MSGISVQDAARDAVRNFVSNTAIEGTDLNKLQALAFACIALAASVANGQQPSPSWKKIPAEWTSAPQMVRSLVEWNGSLLVGTGRPAAGGAEIYRLEGGVLKRRAGFTSERLVSMTVSPDNKLHVGVGSELPGPALVGKYHADTPGTGILDGSAANWTTLKNFPAHCFVYAQAWLGDVLYVGLINKHAFGSAEIWRQEPSGWMKVASPGFNGWPTTDDSIGVYELWPHHGEMYASTFSYTLGNGKIYKLTSSGWIDTNVPATLIPLTMTSYDGDIVAGLQNAHSPAHANPIFRLRDGVWEPLGVAPSEWSGAWLPNHIVTGPDGYVYAALGGDLGKLQVWKYDGQWSKLGGNGLYGSWTNPVSSAPSTAEWFYRIRWFDGKLYVGIAANAGANAALWEMTP